MLLKFTPKTEHLKMIALTPQENSPVTRNMLPLLPGVNEVSENEWLAMRPNISTELSSGEITILAQKVSDGRGKPGGRKAKDLVQMPINIAVRYASECQNAESLLKWYKEETRDEVRIIIVEKLKEFGVDLPTTEVPDAPNANPMSLDEFDSTDDGITDDKDNLSSDNDTENDSTDDGITDDKDNLSSDNDTENDSTDDKGAGNPSGNKNKKNKKNK